MSLIKLASYLIEERDGRPVLGLDAMQAVVRAVGNPEDRTIEIIGSTEDVDRYQEVITVSGWQLKNFRANPVFLFGHDYHEPPIGKGLKVWKDTAGEKPTLRFLIKFLPETIYPFADMIYQMYLGGYMNTSSVGFLPFLWEDSIEEARKDPSVPWRTYTKQDLLELSAVPVPANPYALADALAKGVLSESGFNQLRQSGMPVIRQVITVQQDHKVIYQHQGAMLDLSKYSGLSIPEDFDASPVELTLADSPVAPADDKGGGQTSATISTSEPTGAVDKGTADQEQPTEERVARGVTPPNVSTNKAPEDQSWSAPTLKDFTEKTWGELTEAEKKKIAGHFAWAAAMPPEKFGDLKLGHHDPKNGNIVWNGVTAAVARLNQTNVPADDLPAIKAHLRGHYNDFGKEIPDVLKQMPTELEAIAQNDQMTQIVPKDTLLVDCIPDQTMDRFVICVTGRMMRRLADMANVKLGWRYVSTDSSLVETLMQTARSQALKTAMEALPEEQRAALHVKYGMQSTIPVDEPVLLLGYLKALLADDSLAESRAGAVLNAKNKSRIKQAHDNLGMVLAEAEPAGEGEEGKTASPPTEPPSMGEEVVLLHDPEAEHQETAEVEAIVVQPEQAAAPNPPEETVLLLDLEGATPTAPVTLQVASQRPAGSADDNIIIQADPATIREGVREAMDAVFAAARGDVRVAPTSPPRGRSKQVTKPPSAKKKS